MVCELGYHVWARVHLARLARVDEMRGIEGAKHLVLLDVHKEEAVALKDMLEFYYGVQYAKRFSHHHHHHHHLIHHRFLESAEYV